MFTSVSAPLQQERLKNSKFAFVVSACWAWEIMLRCRLVGQYNAADNKGQKQRLKKMLAVVIQAVRLIEKKIPQLPGGLIQGFSWRGHDLFILYVCVQSKLTLFVIGTSGGRVKSGDRKREKIYAGTALRELSPFRSHVEQRKHENAILSRLWFHLVKYCTNT